MMSIIETLTAEAPDKVRTLQRAIAQLPQFEPETEHYFADGMYCRSVARPQGCTIVGKVHKREHLYVVCCGTVLVAGNDGPAVEYTGPAVIVSKPGTKRAVYAVTDAVCLTVHRTDNRDLEDIERELVEEDVTALFDCRNNVIHERIAS